MGKGSRESFKPILNSMEVVPGTRRRQRVSVSPLGTSSATVLVDLQVKGRKTLSPGCSGKARLHLKGTKSCVCVCLDIESDGLEAQLGSKGAVQDLKALL